MLYITLKFVHILLAIIAVGFTTSFGLISARAARAGDREMMYALKTIALMSNIAHGCYLLLLITGLWMIWVVGYPFSFTWIYLSLILFTLAFLAGSFMMIPSVKRRMAILQERGSSDPELIELSQRAMKLGPILGVVTLVIIWLMVAKPI